MRISDSNAPAYVLYTAGDDGESIAKIVVIATNGVDVVNGLTEDGKLVCDGYIADAQDISQDVTD